MSDDLMRVAYLSANAIEADQAGLLETINGILAISQENNTRVGVTGALMFNRGFFGQILEGPTEAVEETFERIQNDDRHHSVALLETKPIETLSFQDWSMGFVGTETALVSAFQDGFSDSTFNVTDLNADDMFRVLNKLAYERELSLTA